VGLRTETEMAAFQGIRINAERCTGCRICESICAFNKHDEFNPKRSRIRIVKMERFFLDVPVVCQQCPEPSCVAECPVGALKKGEDHVVHVEEDLCTGCERCIDACPFRGISIDPISNVAIICDLCRGAPECVQWCPTRAIELGPPQRPSNSVSSTAQSLLRKWGIPEKEYEEYFLKFQDRKIKQKFLKFGT